MAANTTYTLAPISAAIFDISHSTLSYLTIISGHGTLEMMGITSSGTATALQSGWTESFSNKKINVSAYRLIVCGRGYSGNEEVKLKFTTS